jgi:histidinol-phosphate aminotransferase
MPVDTSRSPSTPTALQPTLSRRGLLGAALLAPLATGLGGLSSALAAAPRARAVASLVRLDSNENPYGPSPAARQAILACIPDTPRYADAALVELIATVATRHDVETRQVTIGTGSGELLKIAGLLAAEGGGGGQLIAAHPTYEELPDFATKMGVQTRWVEPDAEHRHDLQAMHDAIVGQTRLVYICNPNNPTGAAVGRASLERFIRAVPSSTLVVVDEAYVDLADDPEVRSVIDLARDCPNLVVLRTFSKIHGLAGLRIGYSIAGPALAARITSKQLTFPNVAGLRGAIASLGDHQFLADTHDALVADRRRVHATLDRLGRPRTRSQGNFVFFDTGMPLPTFAARMLAKGIKIGRHFDRYDNWARITIGTRPEVDRLLEALPGALGA